ncbi:hypothetical protein JK358_26955 [Nocardia sp. 2]|uniref:Citrate transporter n=1 Tax=Nocardia acididurans TaxID=2802282 RepID=A0ABS1MCS6_9NOCA|nr:hypothetical protein [Nocardia acididurans]MBL1078049.1 hypothetical protein [Nocardia acididurans]
MYTLLFLLILLCVAAVIRDWPRGYVMALCSATLGLSVLAFLPHVVGRPFGIEL